MRIRDKFDFGKNSESNLDTVSSYLQMAAVRSISCSPVDFGVPWMGGRRNAEEQGSIFVQGNSRCDGYNTISFHQKTDDKGLGLALDLVPYIKGVGFSYDAPGRSGIIGMLMLEAWEELQDDGLIPEDLYLHWGGLWSHSSPATLGWDMAHFEERNKPQIEKV